MHWVAVHKQFLVFNRKSCKSGEIRRIKSYISASPVKGPFARPLMLELARLVQHPKLTEECGEEASVGGHVLNPHCLADRVHGERRHPQVDSPDSYPGGDDWPNGGSTGTVISHHKLLHWCVGSSRELTQQEPCLGIGCIPAQKVVM